MISKPGKFMTRDKGVGSSPKDLFSNGEQGSLWGPIPYYSDAAGTVEADWGDPVGNIPDASGNGNDWTQVTSTARPILGRVPVGGRRNLLRWTEDFGNAVWNKTAGGTGTAPAITANFAPGPDGTAGGAHRIQMDIGVGATSSDLSFIVQQLAGFVPGTPVTRTAYIKSATESNYSLLMRASELGNKAIVAGQEWERVEYVGNSTTNAGIGLILWGHLGTAKYADILVAYPQLETGSVATDYQKVASQYDITEAGVRGIHYLRFDGTDDQVTTTLPAISGGTIVLAGTNGIWIDSLDFAGGAFSVGPGTYTGGPTGLIPILGDMLAEGGFVIDRALTPGEIAQVKGYYKARGAGDFLVPLDPSVVAVIRPTVDTSPENWIRYHNGKSYPDGPEWQGIIDAHPAWSGIASEVIDSQHMVKVPKFYVQTKDTAAGGVIYLVSDNPRPGFQVHPAFFNAGEEIDHFWIGAYHASEVSGIFESQPNVLPRVSLSGVTAIERMEARNTGEQTGWGSQTWHQICAVRLLCLIEIGTPDVRTAIGQGWNSATSNSGPGAELQPTGTSDANWRGIYDLWGNVHTLGTGLEFRNGRAWLADENGDLIDTGHDMPAARHIGACAGGYLAWAFLPTADGPTASSAGYTSYQWMNTSGTRAARHGSSFSIIPAQTGLFSLRGDGPLGSTFAGYGFRLAKV